MKSDQNIGYVYCAEEFPPTLKIVFVSDEKFDCSIDMMDGSFDPSKTMREVKSLNDIYDDDYVRVLNALCKCIKTWDYCSSKVRIFRSKHFGYCVYFENDRGTKFLIGITGMY